MRRAGIDLGDSPEHVPPPEVVLSADRHIATRLRYSDE
jgi:hypothetical protein